MNTIKLNTIGEVFAKGGGDSGSGDKVVYDGQNQEDLAAFWNILESSVPKDSEYYSLDRICILINVLDYTHPAVIGTIRYGEFDWFDDGVLGAYALQYVSPNGSDHVLCCIRKSASGIFEFFYNVA